jgi:hypothetical protein
LSTLRPVRTPSLTQLLLFALLAFQLGFGLQQQSFGAPASHAETAHHHAMSASADGACPLHAGAGSPNTSDNDKHDCCKSSACQCQCGNVSFAVMVSGPKGIPASTQVQPITAVRVATAPPDTLFRPPILA